MRALDVRLLLLALPALCVSVLAVALLGGLGTRSVRAARVYGGPTSAPEQSYRVEVVDSYKGTETPAPGKLRVVVRSAQGHEAAWSGQAGPDGVAEVKVPALPHAKRFELGVFQEHTTLAEGAIELGRDAWLGAATRRGGWTSYELDDATELELAPASGAFAVPFASELLLRVRRDGEPLHAELELSAEGASVAPAQVSSGPAPARAVVKPQAHSIGLRVRVAAGGMQREVLATLSAVPGAMHAELVGERLIVTSPVPRERAYFTVVSERRRVTGGSLALDGDGRGPARGEARLPALPAEPLWAVVASTPDLGSAARVGVPIGKHPEPATTLDVPERLLLDGVPRALSRESARRKKVRFIAAGACVLSLLLGALLIAARSRSSARALARHFEDRGLLEGERRALIGEQPLWLWAALGTVALGFVALAVFALLVER